MFKTSFSFCICYLFRKNTLLITKNGVNEKRDKYAFIARQLIFNYFIECLLLGRIRIFLTMEKLFFITVAAIFRIYIVICHCLSRE